MKDEGRDEKNPHPSNLILRSPVSSCQVLRGVAGTPDARTITTAGVTLSDEGFLPTANTLEVAGIPTISPSLAEDHGGAARLHIRGVAVKIQKSCKQMAGRAHIHTKEPTPWQQNPKSS
jgi:hypothetical protein